MKSFFKHINDSWLTPLLLWTPIIVYEIFCSKFLINFITQMPSLEFQLGTWQERHTDGLKQLLFPMVIYYAGFYFAALLIRLLTSRKKRLQRFIYMLPLLVFSLCFSYVCTEGITRFVNYISTFGVTIDRIIGLGIYVFFIISSIWLSAVFARNRNDNFKAIVAFCVSISVIPLLLLCHFLKCREYQYPILGWIGSLGALAILAGWFLTAPDISYNGKFYKILKKIFRH